MAAHGFHLTEQYVAGRVWALSALNIAPQPKRAGLAPR